MTPLPNNPIIVTVDQDLVAAVDAAVTIGETLLIADYPFLAIPGIKQIWEALFTWIASYVEKGAERGVAQSVIIIQTSAEESNLSNALEALIAAERSGNAESIQAAIKAYAQAQSALINSNGAGPSH